jgi:uncharacterized protein (TIGR02646 family)
MIKRTCPRPVDEPWFVEWNTRAETAARQLVLLSAERPIKVADIDEALYKEPRNHIFKKFHGKCAYCETRYETDQTGDVEHFRPKCGTTDLNNRKVDHPGYYWLAYTWENLLPSCSQCNRLSNKSGVRYGKGNRFPVANNAYHRDPADWHALNDKPLIIHPVFEDPARHLEFDPLGMLIPRTPEGETTIELFGLNCRESLVDERREAYDSMQNLLKDFADALAKENAPEISRLTLRLTAYFEKRPQYMIAADCAFKKYGRRIQPLINLFHGAANP